MSNILTNLLKETSPSRLLRIVSTGFLALRLFSFNIRQQGRQMLHFNLHVDGRKFHYRRPHATVRPQVVHYCFRQTMILSAAESWFVLYLHVVRQVMFLWGMCVETVRHLVEVIVCNCADETFCFHVLPDLLLLVTELPEGINDKTCNERIPCDMCNAWHSTEFERRSIMTTDAESCQTLSIYFKALHEVSIEQFYLWFAGCKTRAPYDPAQLLLTSKLANHMLQSSAI